MDQLRERVREARSHHAIAEELGLSDAQKADIRKNVESARRDRLRKTTDLRIARLDLQSLMRAEKIDDKAIAAKIAEIQTAQGALLKLRVDTALAMKRVLTPEQQKKAAELRQDRGRGHGLKRLRQRIPREGGRSGRRHGRGVGDDADDAFEAHGSDIR